MSNRFLHLRNRDLLARLYRLLPALSFTGLVILARLLGILAPLEWKSFDWLLRWRPDEAIDSRVTIIQITEDDIQNELGYPISDRALAALIEEIQTYSPRTIGIDIFRDLPVGEGQTQLAAVLEAKNVIGITKIEEPVVLAHPTLPEERIGFANVEIDQDGYLRRSLLASEDSEGNYRFSLTIRLAQQYLAADNFLLENGIKDPETMRFGTVEIPRFQSDTGGYVREDNGGNQTLINFRAGEDPFESVSYAQVMSGDINPQLLEDRAVLIGYTAESVKDVVSSLAIDSDKPSLIPGIVIQAHALSQILSAVYESRPFIRSLPDALEYIATLCAGALGIALALWQRKPSVHFAISLAAIAFWLFFCYLAILFGWWIPSVPVTLAFGLNTLWLYPLRQAQVQADFQIEERRRLIDWTYNTIHNGPLQTIAGMLRQWPEDQLSSDSAIAAHMKLELEALNKDLRSIYETMQQEMLATDGGLVMTGNRTVSLQLSLDALLYEIYQNTVARQRAFFEKVIQITQFEPLDEKGITAADKRELARFLEESLLNVYKHAGAVSRVSIDCLCDNGFNIIRVVDNGKGTQQDYPRAQKSNQQTAYGTKQAKRLAGRLGGQFKLEAIRPYGSCCELKWPIR